MSTPVKTASLARSRAQVLPSVVVRVASGPDAGKRVTLKPGTSVVGKSSECQLALTDPAVSRQHLSIDLLEGRLRVTDLGSKNGTRYLGAKVKTVEVPLGASLDLGTTRLTFESAQPDSPVEADRTELAGLFGTSRAMRRLFHGIEVAAKSDAPVLVHGETGTGKEQVARALHQLSVRAQGPLVVVDLGAMPANLIQSTLFGHEKGAFTGAVSSSKGLLAQADGGTLFLDEVGELPLELQPVLLRALETSTYQPLGGSKRLRSDFRLISATHRDLRQEAKRGRFRQDLYFRLAALQLDVPALRDRLEDIPLLAQRFAQEAGASLALSASSIARLCAHRWPGNVRELRNVVRRALALGTEAALGDEGEVGGEAAGADFHTAREQALKAFEKSYLVWLLDRNDGQRAAAAREANVARSYFYRLLDAHGLSGKKKGEP